MFRERKQLRVPDKLQSLLQRLRSALLEYEAGVTSDSTGPPVVIRFPHRELDRIFPDHQRQTLTLRHVTYGAFVVCADPEADLPSEITPVEQLSWTQSV